jgi:hypothetical protein
MTNGKSDNKQIVVIDNKTTLETWGDKDQIREMGDRIGRFLPGDLSKQDNLALAQFATLTGANPFRGEIYAYKGRGGKLTLVEGYKLLVRWARQIADYTSREVELTPEEKTAEGIAKNDIAWWCYILRNDKKAQVKEWIEIGFEPLEAYEIVATKALGVVQSKSTVNAPPEGWSWGQVAKKRALKNALNLSHGMPSPRELASQSWQVDGQETIPEDWEGVEDLQPQVRDEAARREAQKREMKVSHPAPEDQEERVNLVRGEEDQDILEVSPEPEPKEDIITVTGAWWTTNKNRYLVKRIVGGDLNDDPVGLFEFVGASDWETFGLLYNDVEAAQGAAADFKATL